MLLAIDCGNTNTVFSIWDERAFTATWRIATDHRRTAEEYYVWLSSLTAVMGMNIVISEVVISSTVPRVVFNLRILCHQYYNCRPLVVGKEGCRLPISPKVDQGVIVGPDRLVNSLAAYRRHGGNLIVVDFGTATTFDVVDAEGAYIGGAIAPGVNLSLEALHTAAAALPHVDVRKPEKVIGTNTVACIQSGVYWGYIGLIEKIVEAICVEYGHKMKVIATGGFASLFVQGTHIFDMIEENLTMYGLVFVRNYNKEIQ